MLDKTIYEKLSNYCAYQERCSEDVRQKLLKLKVEKTDFEAYLEKLKDENFLSDERYVKYFVSAHEKKKWGKTKMKTALLAKRIEATLIKKYLDDIDEANYDEQLKNLAEKKWNTIKAASLREKQTKLIRFLLSKGYEMGKVVVVAREFHETS